MGDWNEQAAPNNNLPANRIRSQNLKLARQNKYKGRFFENTTNSEK